MWQAPWPSAWSKILIISISRHEADREGPLQATHLALLVATLTTMAIDHSALHLTLQELDVPEDFNVYENTDDAQLIVRLETWRQKACTVLADMQEQLRERDNLTLAEKAEIVFKVSQFDGVGTWILDASRSAAQGELYVLLTPACRDSQSDGKRSSNPSLMATYS